MSSTPSIHAGYRSPMAKALTIFGMVVAGLLGLAFIADLAVGVPFAGARKTMDVGALVASAVLGYLAWDAFREAK